MKFVAVFMAAAVMTFGSLYMHKPAQAAEPLKLVVTNTNASGAGSLSDAINKANAVAPNPGTQHLITFNIPGDGVHVIDYVTTLRITQPTIIDATTQPGASCGELVKLDTDGTISDDNIPHNLKVQFSAAGTDRALFELTSTAIGSTIKGMIMAGGRIGSAVSTAANNVTIECSYIGMSADGETPIARSDYGRFPVDFAPGSDGSVLRNSLISGSAEKTDSVWVRSSNVTIDKNLIGTNAAGSHAVINSVTGAVSPYGIGFRNRHDIHNINISHNIVIASYQSIRIQDSPSPSSRLHDIQIKGNYINTALDGTTALIEIPNSAIIVAADGGAIGSPEAGGRNIVAGGITIIGSVNTSVKNNYIGIGKINEPLKNFTGSENAVFMVGADSGNNSVTGNVIGGFRNGIVTGQMLRNGTYDCKDLTIDSNYIGLSQVGQAAPIDLYGINLNCQNSVVKDNIIGNIQGPYGIIITNRSGSSSNAQVYGNRLGIAKDGSSQPLKSSGIGVSYNDDTILIGKEGAGNTIVGAYQGVEINGASSGQYTIQYNDISNSRYSGVRVGSGSQNVAIKYNTVHDGVRGVQVLAGAHGVDIQGNSIYRNTVTGIELQSYQNDLKDVDTGIANEGQNAPMITRYQGCSGTGGLLYGLNSTPNTTFRIDVYENDAADAGNLQGRSWQRSFEVTTDGDGAATFKKPAAADGGTISHLTMTATDPDGNTSPFSSGERTWTLSNCGTTPKITNDNTPSLAGTARVNVQGDLAYPTQGYVEIIKDGKAVAKVDAGVMVFEADGTWTLADGALPTIPDGRYTVKIGFRDSVSGAVLSHDTPNALTIDTTRPTATVARVTEQPAFTNQNSATFLVTFSEPVANL